MKKASHTGERFGHLTILKESKKITQSGKAFVECLCECGTKKSIQIAAILSGHTKSCGCIKNKPIHGGAVGYKKTGAYSSYLSMKSRCFNPNDAMFPVYGGRGITVCKRWIASFENFKKDMGERPKGKTLDRLNSNGNYEPRNCEWKTHKEQARNRRTSRVFTVRGITGCLSGLCERFNAPYWRTKHRINKGENMEDAFFKPHHGSRPPV